MTDRGQGKGMQEKLCKQRAEYVLKTQKGKDRAQQINNQESRSILSGRSGQFYLKKNTEKNGRELTRTPSCCIPLCGWYLLVSLPPFQKV